MLTIFVGVVCLLTGGYIGIHIGVKGTNDLLRDIKTAWTGHVKSLSTDAVKAIEDHLIASSNKLDERLKFFEPEATKRLDAIFESIDAKIRDRVSNTEVLQVPDSIVQPAIKALLVTADQVTIDMNDPSITWGKQARDELTKK